MIFLRIGVFFLLNPLATYIIYFVMKRTIILTSLLLYSLFGYTQKLQPGFNKEEYIELLRISVCSVKDSTYANKHEKPKNHTMIYQSGSIGWIIPGIYGLAQTGQQ